MLDPIHVPLFGFPEKEIVLAWLQRVVSLPALTFGKLFTVTLVMSEFVHPKLSVTFNVND